MLKRKKEEIKTGYALGKTGFKEAKEELTETTQDAGEMSDSGTVLIHNDAWNYLVDAAHKEMKKHAEQGPYAIVERLVKDSKVKQFIKEGKMKNNFLEEQILQAVSEAVTRYGDELSKK
ncbi:MAG: hypothetical protein V1870_00670 [Candidatus Aenigmatarchaeota archaeon]